MWRPRGWGSPVPPHAVVTDAVGAACNAFAEYAAYGGQVCMKPVTGVGGEGYRRLTASAPASDDFLGEVRSVVRVDDVSRAWDHAGGAPVPTLVMPFLDGARGEAWTCSPPRTARCSGWSQAGDTRPGDRRRTIVDDWAARETARTLTATHRIGYLSNTQVRYWRGPQDSEQRAYLLEVNTRAAGGLFQTALAGVNLPWGAVQLAIGEQPDPIVPVFGATYVQVAGALPLRR